MKKIILIFILSGVMIFADTDKIKAAGDLMWYTSFNNALEDAGENNNIILLNFTGSDWCSWCHKLDADVFSKKEFKTWQEKKVTLLHLDFPQNIKLNQDQIDHNQLLAEIYGVQGFPTIIILDKDGKIITRTGYGDNVTTWISNIESKIKLYNKLTSKL